MATKKQVTEKAAPAKEKYTASAITVLEGLDPVRKRPGMYIGDTDVRGLHHMVWEIVDNAIDEAANGYADRIEVTVLSDGSIRVADNGRGMPVDIHPGQGVSGIELIFSRLHAGGKFDNKSYSYSGGLHGVGASVVNALSRWLTAESLRGGKRYRIEFESRDDGEGNITSGTLRRRLRVVSHEEGHGSVVHFMPDDRVFHTVEFDYQTISQKLRELAFLNAGLTIVFTDERREGEDRRSEFCYKNGLGDFMRYYHRGKTVMYDEPIVLSGECDGIGLQAVLQHTDGYNDTILSYVNNIRTTEGGTHETGFKTALTKVMNTAARELGILKDKDENYVGEDLREGLTAILLVKMKDAQFEGQTKTKLGNISAKTAVETVVLDQLGRFSQNRSNVSVVRSMLEKAKAAKSVRDATKKANDLARKKNSLEVSALVGKFSPSIGRDVSRNEMFIVEGDSAGGSAKQGRDRNFQAILPLRGKPVNSEKRRLELLLSNEEIRSIITALGTGIGRDFAIENLRYDKVIILSDADQDGAHIRALLLTFFYRYMRELITEGHVYIGVSPLYRIERKADGKVFFAYDDAECERITAELGESRAYTISRYKGLGEMNPSLLWETTMSPASRTLIRVGIEDAVEAENMVTILMGDDAARRQSYIFEHADFNRKDDFERKAGV
ncbi:MAG: DNA gyrase subunit B [Clostridia bacterium]|nr:DNA gyrase subunit B [Clostridia bacterium]